ncbi:MAG: NCS2 family permease [Alphaproteobacteria bacterium]|nr:NCS2 family permease [Alphaproteobacteria bacterium]
MLDRWFALADNGTTARREVLAGATTFLTMAYIIFVNPAMLAETGMDRGAVFVATCLAAAIGSLIMGLLANYPIALAPGMGMNAFFAYTVVIGMGHSWQVALGCVFLSGALFVALSLFKVREWVIDAVPVSMRMSIAAGIGLLLGFIALTNAGIVVAHPSTFLTLGKLGAPGALLAALGFLTILALDARRVPGAVMIGILAVTFLAMAAGLTPWGGLAAMPPAIAPTLFAMDVMGALRPDLIAVIFAMLFMDVFDTAGSLIGTGQAAGLLDRHGKLPRIGRALLADSAATVVGAALGTSNTTSYIESLSGIRAGGRTGLTAVAAAGCFLLALFLAPLAGAVPAYATAAALFYVACVMAKSLAALDWDDITEYGPAMVAAISIPLTFSIATGIGLAFISYASVKLVAGRAAHVGIATWVIAAAFALKFAVM